MSRNRNRRRSTPPAKSPGAASSKSGVLWLYGAHAVAAAVVNEARTVRRLMVTATHKDDANALVQKAGKSMLIEVTSSEDLSDVLPPGAVHQGWAAEALPLDPIALEDILDVAPERAVMVALDQVTDPQNVGAILRAAAAFGAVCVLVQDRHSPPETGALAKAASGALDMVPLVRVTNLSRSLAQCQQAGWWTVGLTGGASQPLRTVSTDGRVVLILGAEGSGLRRLTAETCDQLVHIPMDPRMESLNVSAATAVTLYALTAERFLAEPP